MTGVDDIDELLASWNSADPAASFSTAGMGSPGRRELSFAIELSPDTDVAQARLQSKEDSLRQGSALIDQVEQRLTLRIAQGPMSSAVDPELTSPLVPFSLRSGAPETATEDDVDATSQVRLLLSRVTDLVSNFARVETRSDATSLAATRIGWTGDCTTVWARDTTPEQMTLHLRAVRSNLAARMAMVRLLALVVAGAGTLAVQWSLPGGALRALPTAWRLVKELIAEAKQLDPTRPISDGADRT